MAKALMYSLLKDLIIEGKPKEIATVLDSGIDVNCTYDDGKTCLSLLCYMNYDKKTVQHIATLLLAKGANPYVKDFHGISCLGHACKNKKSEIVERLLPYVDKTDIIEQDKKGNCCLHYIIQNDDALSLGKVFKALGTSDLQLFSIRNNEGRTPLQYILYGSACYQYLRECVRNPSDEGTQNSLETLTHLKKQNYHQKADRVVNGLDEKSSMSVSPTNGSYSKEDYLIVLKSMQDKRSFINYCNKKFDKQHNARKQSKVFLKSRFGNGIIVTSKESEKNTLKESSNSKIDERAVVSPVKLSNNNISINKNPKKIKSAAITDMFRLSQVQLSDNYCHSAKYRINEPIINDELLNIKLSSKARRISIMTNASGRSRKESIIPSINILGVPKDSGTGHVRTRRISLSPSLIRPRSKSISYTTGVFTRIDHLGATRSTLIGYPLPQKGFFDKSSGGIGESEKEKQQTPVKKIPKRALNKFPELVK